MAMPTDRGYAVIFSSDDGTVTVKVCAAIEGGQPVGVYAQHVKASAVRIDPAVRLVATASYRYTTKVVEVSRRGSAVIVRTVQGLPTS